MSAHPDSCCRSQIGVLHGFLFSTLCRWRYQSLMVISGDSSMLLLQTSSLTPSCEIYHKTRWVATIHTDNSDAGGLLPVPFTDKYTGFYLSLFYGLQRMVAGVQLQIWGVWAFFYPLRELQDWVHSNSAAGWLDAITVSSGSYLPSFQNMRVLRSVRLIFRLTAYLLACACLWEGSQEYYVPC